MKKKPKFKKTLDLTFAGVSFACILAIFSSTVRSDYVMKSANTISVFLPLLVGAFLAEDIVLVFPRIQRIKFTKYLIFGLGVLASIAALGCYVGIYYFFCSISDKSGHLFLNSSFIVLGIILLLAVVTSMMDWEMEAKEKKQK